MNEPQEKLKTLDEMATRIMKLRREIAQEAAGYTSGPIPTELASFAQHLIIAGTAIKNLHTLLSKS